MVRVINVHHFASQHVQTIEQPTASTIAPPNRLLLALSSHCIEVRDLKTDGDVLFTFPTVDEVTQIVHCLNGDYVATIETKYNRQNKDTNFVRVYVNWDSVAALQQSKMTSSGVSLGSSECGMVQPMRARIAGRVTPTTNQSELGSLEMIEIPTRQNPNLIECCQVSGNLIITSNKTIVIYTFQIKTHDISKLRFIDFEELSINIELNFVPMQIGLCENYIACISTDSMYMFKLLMNTQQKSNNSVQYNNSSTNFSFKYAHPDVKVDYKKLLHDEALFLSGEKITVNLPSVVRSNSAIHKHSPFTFCDKEMSATINATSVIDNTHNFEIKNLIQLKLLPILIENAHRQVSEEFKCMVLKPLYVEENMNGKVSSKRDVNNKLIKSEYRNNLSSIVCMIATQQEGYLYQFCDSDASNNIDNCISVYPFTAPVYKLVMEDCFVHALTEAGLESYTLRTGHQLCRYLETIDNIHTACPPVNDSICLVGLRPFLGIEKILLSNTNLVLLANADSSPTHSVGSNSSSNASYWTLYNLELPTSKMIFNDISIVANVHRFTSTQTYCHLMSEAHMILRLSLMLVRWSMHEGHVTLITPHKENVDDLIEMYRTSCSLLGDHFIMCASDDNTLSLPYYRMARLYPFDVLRRVKKIQEQSNNQSIKGLLYYLKTVLLEIKSGPHVDKFFAAGSKQNFAEAILTLFENHNYKELPNLILKSSILREYSTDRLINILTNQKCELSKQTEKSLALVILYIQRCNMEKAQNIIEGVAVNELFDLLLGNWELLFESTLCAQNRNKIVTTFSELTEILITTNPDVLSELLVTLMLEKKVLNLNKFLKVFLEYLPSSIGSDGNTASIVLQKTLEIYFQKYFGQNDNCDFLKTIYDRATHEAFKLLVRSYLSQLQILQLKEKNNDDSKNECSSGPVSDDDCKLSDCDDNSKDNQQEKFKYNQVNKIFFEEQPKKKDCVDCYLFSNLRYEYLDRMPPFQIEITSKFYETCLENYVVKERLRPNAEADLILRKLQALLCSELLPKQVIAEVNTFLAMNESLRGNDSLRSITMNISDAILFLAEVCPQCLLQYSKDRFTKTEEWKLLIATIQQKILSLSSNDDLKRVCFFHKKILKDTLTYVATTMNLDQLTQVFPQRLSVNNSLVTIDGANQKNAQATVNDDLLTNDDAETTPNADILEEIQNYEPYILICKETMHANQFKKIIIATGQQLLCALNT